MHTFRKIAEEWKADSTDALGGRWVSCQSRWQVGYWLTDGTWKTLRDYPSEEQAAAAVNMLNGSAQLASFVKGEPLSKYLPKWDDTVQCVGPKRSV